MLVPKKLKRRKPHRPDVRGVATAGNYAAFGSYALKATTGGWIKAQQIEASLQRLRALSEKLLQLSRADSGFGASAAAIDLLELRLDAALPRLDDGTVDPNVSTE